GLGGAGVVTLYQKVG
ncbi:hypothetical protein, partial [Tsukamurella ocularis]